MLEHCSCVNEYSLITDFLGGHGAAGSRNGLQPGATGPFPSCRRRGLLLRDVSFRRGNQRSAQHSLDVMIFRGRSLALENFITSGHLAIRFRRLKCGVVTRSSRFMSPVGKSPVEAAKESDRYRPLICTFSEVGQLVMGTGVAELHTRWFAL